MQDRYCLQMVACNNHGDGKTENIYSTEEIICGTWVDGKKIYRKVISGTLNTENGNNLELADVSNLHIERLLNMYGCLTEVETNAQVTIPVFYVVGSSNAAIYFYYSADKKIKYHLINNDGRYSGSKYYLTLEYTKEI